MEPSLTEFDQPLRGTLLRTRGAYTWMRIGFAPAAFRNFGVTLAIAAILALWTWIALEIARLHGALLTFLIVYLACAAFYLNVGVWLHEQLHCLAFRGTIDPARVRITYFRRYIFTLGGFYSVRGSLTSTITRQALLGPLYMTLGLTVIGIVGSFILPGWWLPSLLSFVVVSLLDMLHDLYMYSQVRLLDRKARFWDRGRHLEAVWKT